MATVNRFEDLRCWQEARVFEDIGYLPQEEIQEFRAMTEKTRAFILTLIRYLSQDK